LLLLLLLLLLGLLAQRRRLGARRRRRQQFFVVVARLLYARRGRVSRPGTHLVLPEVCMSLCLSINRRRSALRARERRRASGCVKSCPGSVESVGSCMRARARVGKKTGS
jgi:hypothetical protein